MKNVEIERKYIIEKPNLDLLSQMDGYTSSEIEQVYLDSPKEITHRIRRRAYADRVEHTETKKVRIDKTSAYEDERIITPQEYESLLQKRAEGSITLNKVRHTFKYSGQIFEVDIYPNWTYTCIMEIELPTRDTVVNMPPFIRIVREVTGEREYSNASMSRKFPKEDE